MILEATDTISMLIVDDQPIYRAGVRQALTSADPSLQVVGEAANGHDMLQLVEDLAPNVVLLTAEVEGLNGMEAVRAIRRTGRNTSVIISSTFDDEEQLFYAIKFGAAAYVRKSVSIAELCSVVRRVAAGEYLINDSILAKPLLASKVLSSFRNLTDEADNQVEQLYLPLSPREIQVLDYIARGNSNKDIARALGISDQTVKNHITSIMRKLAVNDRTQAVVYALHHGWIKA